LIVAARHLNFTRAAEELGLTAAAVSYQVKEFEDQLGALLFLRSARTLKLTEAGRIFCEAASDSIQGLHRAQTRIRKLSRGTEILKITVDPQFATKWLMHRVENFRRLHPTIELRFDVAYEVRDFERDDIDVAIRFGMGKYPGLVANRLFENEIVPVCSPKLMQKGPPLTVPEDLKNHTLAHIEWSRQGVTWPNWRMWMAAAGVADFDDSRTIVFDKSMDAIEAAIAGGAVTLADFAMVANDLSEGRLIRPFEISIRVPAEFAYFLVYPADSVADPRITVFRDWLLEAVSEFRG
jgi:LysR family glycine cleavage system transcriptional activator